MSRTPRGIRVGSFLLPQQPTLFNMTRSELNFALLVEEMLNHIAQPEYRQIIVEVSILFEIKANSTIHFNLRFTILTIESTV